MEDHGEHIVVNLKNHWGNAWEIKMLEELDGLKQVPNNNYPILFITEPSLMRGHNYRSGQGITLILCRGFKSARDVTQAKGRVGRYRDPYRRFTTVEDLVDRKLKLPYIKSLNEHLAKKDN